jgi:crotonobetainyl-CoA:carnitine CoA-transferase CaiB-like acyl-CoA transferase
VAEPTGPLAGVRVVELSTVIMAPLACQLLGDLGADVIKVESDKGDFNRVMGGGPHPQLSGVALNLHRNKRSIQLDLAQPDASAVLSRLLDAADILVTNFRPRALRKLGLDYESVAPTRPGLVYCEAHGFSVESGEADRPAYDDIMQAATGLLALAETATGTVSYLPTIVADKVAGLTIVYSVLAALRYRERTGHGQRVEIPMFDTVLAFNLVEHLSQAAVPGGRPGYNRVLNRFRRPHRTKDGYVAMLPYNDQSWADLYNAVGHGDELEQPHFRHRLQHLDLVYESLGRIMLEKTTAEWLELARRLGIPAGPVPSVEELVEDPAQHRGVLREDDHPVAGRYRQIAPTARFSRTPASVHRPAPLLGQDTVAVLDELGLDAQQVKLLLDSGAAGAGPARSRLPGRRGGTGDP